MNPLKQFPEPVTQLISLEELYLNDTSLDYLPANIGRLVQLRILELRDNRLSTLPKAFARFSRLVRLDIGQNDFNYLVSSVFVHYCELSYYVHVEVCMISSKLLYCSC